MELVTEYSRKTEQEPLRIVIIDDSEAVCRSLSLLLRASGYDAVSYMSAHLALDDHAFDDADCLLIDFKMPVMDGVALLAALREQGVKTPAILISGVVTTGLSDRAIKAGFTAFMRKPMTQADLKDAIKTALH